MIRNWLIRVITDDHARYTNQYVVVFSNVVARSIATLNTKQVHKWSNDYTALLSVFDRNVFD